VTICAAVATVSATEIIRSNSEGFHFMFCTNNYDKFKKTIVLDVAAFLFPAQNTSRYE